MHWPSLIYLHVTTRRHEQLQSTFLPSPLAGSPRIQRRDHDLEGDPPKRFTHDQKRDRSGNFRFCPLRRFRGQRPLASVSLSSGTYDSFSSAPSSARDATSDEVDVRSVASLYSRKTNSEIARRS